MCGRMEKSAGADSQVTEDMASHTRAGHKESSRMWAIVITNQCPYCKSTFASQTNAVKHTRVALQQNRCQADQSPSPHPVRRQEEPVGEYTQQCLRDRGQSPTDWTSTARSNGEDHRASRASFRNIWRAWCRVIEKTHERAPRQTCACAV